MHKYASRTEENSNGISTLEIPLEIYMPQIYFVLYLKYIKYLSELGGKKISNKLSFMAKKVKIQPYLTIVLEVLSSILSFIPNKVNRQEI